MKIKRKKQELSVSTHCYCIQLTILKLCLFLCGICLQKLGKSSLVLDQLSVGADLCT